DVCKGFGITREKIFNRLLRCFGDVTQGVNADLELVGRMPCAPAKFPIDVNERTEPPRLAADDGDHQRQSEHSGAGERLRCPADSEPDWQRILHRSRINALPGEWCPMFAGPVNEFVFTDVEQQVELFCKQKSST